MSHWHSVSKTISMKTKNILALILFVILTALASSSCKKNDEGGKAEIHAEIFHGTTQVRNSTLYVKFGATSAPADPTGNYDLKLSGTQDDNHVHVEDLRRGDYFLYAVGVDTLLNQPVSGGAHVEIKWKERKKLIEAEVQVK